MYVHVHAYEYVDDCCARMQKTHTYTLAYYTLTQGIGKFQHTIHKCICVDECQRFPTTARWASTPTAQRRRYSRCWRNDDNGYRFSAEWDADFEVGAFILMYICINIHKSKFICMYVGIMQICNKYTYNHTCRLKFVCLYAYRRLCLFVSFCQNSLLTSSFTYASQLHAMSRQSASLLH